MKDKKMCGTCKAFKPMVNYRLGNCLKENIFKRYDQTCIVWIQKDYKGTR